MEIHILQQIHIIDYNACHFLLFRLSIPRFKP